MRHLCSLPLEREDSFRSCQGRLEEIYHLSLCVIRVLLKTYGESLQSKV